MKYDLIRSIFVYLTAFIGVVILTIGSVNLLDLGVKTYIFGIRTPEWSDAYTCSNESNETDNVDNQKELKICLEESMIRDHERWKIESSRSLSINLSLIIVGIPLAYFSLSFAKKIKQN